MSLMAGDVCKGPEADAAAFNSARLREWRAGPQFAATAPSYRVMCRADGVREELHLFQRSSNSGRPIQALLRHRVAQPSCGFPRSRA